ncbi:MAG: hypothetical protein BRD30_12695 [Bacteroidetes bacterium QH_2_63_10]|nr:MAG: hypothetical protein BRD30_12695 [Bacteroidetes bacterium QH_2_63_10]
MDVEGGAALIGARVLLRNVETSDVTQQTATDPEGNFQFERIRPGRYVVAVQLLGYKERRIPLRIEFGDSRVLDVALERKTESLETIVLSASRQRERLLEAIEYWGVETALEAHPTSVLTAFANVSYASDDSFTSADPDVALSSPSFKLRGGVDYGLPAGFSVGATAHYVDAFPVRAGPYVGTVDSYTLLDVRLRSTVPSVPGLSANVTAKNVLGNEHREFVGAPALDRMLTVRLTYELP